MEDAHGGPVQKNLEAKYRLLSLIPITSNFDGSDPI